MPPADKACIRRMMRERRKRLSSNQKNDSDAAICAKLISRFSSLSPVAVYLATKDEIDLSAFISSLLSHGSTVVAPRWNGECYDLARLDSLDGVCLRNGPMDVMEPSAANIVSPREIALWIVPGLAFTRGGLRLGYGGGWYDRLLSAASPDSLRVGVARSFQLLDALPAEPHDIPLSEVVDET